MSKDKCFYCKGPIIFENNGWRHDNSNHYYAGKQITCDIASPVDLFKNGYHLKEIKKGEVGEVSKIREELEEIEDAMEQNCKIMVLAECSDLLGALESFVDKHFNMSLNDLKVMSDITKRAFRSGRRK